jgi:hypothetical protein
MIGFHKHMTPASRKDALMKIKLYPLATGITAVLWLAACGGQSGTSSSTTAVVPATNTAVAPTTNTAAESATRFLEHLARTEIDEALQLWDSTSVNDELKERVEKCSAKLTRFGGIEKVDVGTVEDRRIKAHEKRTGEKIDVVPVEIVCGNESLILAVFSVRRKNGEYKIFRLESLKEWGGTASLDDEQPYLH